MKFIHLGDLHLGKSVNEFSMIEDQKYILERVLDLVRRESVDGVLLAGDIYDRSIPSEEAVKLFDSFLTALAVMGKSVFVIAGNHDSDERLNFGSRLFEANRIYIAGRYDGEIPCIDVEDEYGVVHVWLLPYIKASRAAHYFPQKEFLKENTGTYDMVFQTVIGACDINTSERNMILTHQFVTGKSAEPELAGSENAMLNVGTIDKVSCTCFDAFDYVAMGHIHSPQAVGRETCRYSGSILKYSLNQREIAQEKTVPIVTLREKGDVEVKCVPLKPLRQVRRIKGELAELLKNAVDTEDYIYATLTDEAVQFEAMARLREVYPNTMKLDYGEKHADRYRELSDDAEAGNKSFPELIAEFYQLMNGREPEEAEWTILMEAAREAGVIE